MVKTPEEIKRGLEHCAEIGCKGCPYEEDCKMFDGFSIPAEDAYFYIQQLEQDNAQKDERIQQLEREKEFAVNWTRGLCRACKHYAINPTIPPCHDCKYNTVFAYPGPEANWEWRGVEEEKHAED